MLIVSESPYGLTTDEERVKEYAAKLDGKLQRRREVVRATREGLDAAVARLRTHPVEEQVFRRR